MHHHWITTITSLLIASSSVSAQHNRDLFADLTARNVGDILTIVISETHKIKNEDKVDRSTTSTLAAGWYFFAFAALSARTVKNFPPDRCGLIFSDSGRPRRDDLH